MILTLIICTFKRPEAIRKLLASIMSCSIKPQNILIVDSSPEDDTRNAVSGIEFKDLGINYFKVTEEDRGLTKQRNFGISRLPSNTEIVAFLDDDIRVEPDYFRELIRTYSLKNNAIGVGGIDLQENKYIKKDFGYKYCKFNYYELDGWVAKEPLRYKARKLFGLMPALQPGLIPKYSHGRSALPPNGKIYRVEHLMGGIASYKVELLKNVKFSTFFEGYGLYEDFDFCIRATKYGNLYVNTNAKVWHYHETAGRPDYYKYGKMVVRNGWYVWRVKYPSPSLTAKLKWHFITILLAHIRLVNSILGPYRKDSLMDYLGRITSWFRILVNPPFINQESC